MSKHGWFKRKYREKMDRLKGRNEHIINHGTGGKPVECWCGAYHRVVRVGLPGLREGVVYLVTKATDPRYSVSRR